MNTRLLFLLILPLSLASCVSQQKYNRAVDAQARMNLLRQQYLAENERLAAELDSLQKDTVFIADAFIDTASVQSENELVSKNVEMGQTRGSELNATARVQSSTPIMTPQMYEVQQREQMINELMSQIDQSFEVFSAEELNMRVESEGIYITLHENLLFKGENLTITERGHQALEQLATVMKNNPSTNMRLEGHIDTPSAEEKKENSWNMSFERAVAIGKVLNQSYGINGDRMIVSGRGDFLPLAQNQYPMARVLNRRVEVVLLPVVPEGSSLDALNKK